MILRAAAVLWAAILILGYGARVFAPAAWFRAVSSSLAAPLDFSGFLATWGGHLAGLAVVAGWLLCAVSWGGRGARLIRLSGTAAGSPVIPGIALGLTGLGLAALGLGFLGLLRPVALGILLVPALPDLKAWIKRGAAALRAISRPGPAVTVMAGTTAAFLLMYLAAALAPERGWDALTYHLLAPDRYLAKGRIVILPHVPWSFFPLLSEMWFSLARAFGGDPAARLLNFSFLPLAALTLVRLGKGLTGWLAALFFVSLPGAGLLSSQCYVDLELAWLCLAAFSAALGPGGKWMVASAVMAGAACGCKYSGVWVVGLCGAVWLVRARPLRAGLGPVVLATLLAGAVFAPWAARNWLTTGNPVFPLLAGLFPGAGLEPYYTAGEAAQILPLSGAPGPGDTVLAILRFPTTFSWGIRSIGVLSGALLFAFLPALLPAGSVGRGIKALAAAGLAFSALWIVTGAGHGRFLLPAAALLALPAAEAARRLAGRSRLLQAIVALAVVSGLLTQAMHWSAFVSVTYAPWRVAAGAEPRDLHLARAMLPPFEHMAMARQIKERVPDRSRILILSDLVGYYYGRDAVFDAQQVTPPVALRVLSQCLSPAGMRKRLRQLGLDHVLYTPRVIMFERTCGCVEFESETQDCYERFWRRYASLAFPVGTLKLYRIKSERESERGGRNPLLDLPVVQDRYLTRAQDALEARDSRARERALRELRDTYPDLACGAVKLAWHYLDRGEWVQARRELAAAGRLGANDGEYWLARALITGASGDLAGALEAAGRGVELWPAARPWTVLAGVALNAGKREQARRALREARRLDPGEPEVKRVGSLLGSLP